MASLSIFAAILAGIVAASSGFPHEKSLPRGEAEFYPLSASQEASLALPPTAPTSAFYGEVVTSTTTGEPAADGEGETSHVFEAPTAASAATRAAAASSAESYDELFLLAPIEVIGRRGFDPGTGAGSSIAVEKTRGRVDDAGALLSQETGVHVRDGGGNAALQSISIRGSGGNQVDMFINGVPLPSGLASAVSPGLFPLDALERIDIYRGSAPARYARAPLGGVLDIVTRNPEDAVAGVRAATGSLGRGEVSAFVPVKAGGTHLVLGGGFERSNGAFDYLDNAGTVFNTADDRIRARENNDRSAGNLFLLLEHPGDGVVVRGHALATGFNQGIAGFAWAPARAARLDTRLYATGVETVVHQGDWEFGVAGFGGILRERLRDVLGDFGAPNGNTLNTAEQAGARAVVGYNSRGVVEPELVVEAEWLRFGEETPQSASPNWYRRRLGAALSLRSDLRRLTLTATYHPELDVLQAGAGSNHDEAVHVLHAVSGGAALDIGHGVTLVANAGTGFRIPSIREQFGTRGFQLGNPKLRPETGRFVDAGLQVSGARADFGWFADLRWFRQDIDNIIAVYQSTPKAAKAGNFDSAVAAGGEAELRGSWRELNLGLNGVYQSVVNTGSIREYRGKMLPGRPRWELGFDTGWNAGFVHPFYRLDASGDLFLDPVNSPARHIDERFVHHVGLSVRPMQELTLTANLNNFTDTRTYDYLGLPLPGRTWALVAQYTLH